MFIEKTWIWKPINDDDSLSSCIYIYINQSFWILEKHHMRNYSYEKFNRKGRVAFRDSETDVTTSSFKVKLLISEDRENGK